MNICRLYERLIARQASTTPEKRDASFPARTPGQSAKSIPCSAAQNFCPLRQRGRQRAYQRGMAMPPDDFPNNLIRTIASWLGLALVVAGLIGVLHRKWKRWQARRLRARAHAKALAAPVEADAPHSTAPPALRELRRP